MMKSNFLNLPSSAAGDARRHVPFTSIIHKPLSIIFVLSFVFSILFSYVHPVAALADPQPEYDPVYNTEIIRLTDYVDNNLTPDQQDIFYISFGAYLVAQSAMQDSLLDDPYTTQDGVIGWLKSCGIQFYNSAIVQNALISPSLLVQQGIQDLVDIGMGLAIKAGLYQNKVHFIDDVMNSDHYFFPFNRGLQIGINNVLASNKGLSYWQIHDYEFNFPTWKTGNYSATVMSNYNAAVSDLGTPRMFLNQADAYTDLLGYPILTFDLFYNTTLGTVSVVNESNISGTEIVGIYQTYGRIDTYVAHTFYHNTLNGTLYSSYTEAFQAYIDKFSTYGYVYIRANGRYTNLVLEPLPQQCIQHLWVGATLETAHEFTPQDDLNFQENLNQYYLQVQNDYLLDIKGLIQDLIDVTVLKPVIYDNIYDPSGNQVSPVTNQVSVTVSLPDSGISIPSNLFGPLTKKGGYISYLWYMTKPLVQYTSDLVQTLVFPDDTGEGFDVTGPGVIVFGVISLGLIGGLVVKCLL